MRLTPRNTTQNGLIPTTQDGHPCLLPKPKNITKNKKKNEINLGVLLEIDDEHDEKDEEPKNRIFKTRLDHVKLEAQRRLRTTFKQEFGGWINTTNN